MSFLSNIAGGLGNIVFAAIAFVVVLSIVVFIHELGHFLVARWCGVKVSAFSIGFGTELWGFDDRHGTRWRIAALPLGGYVKFMDDDNPASSARTSEAMAQMTPEQRAGSFHAKPLWQRAAVVAAGPIANFLLAMVIFLFTFWLVGTYSTAAYVDEVLAGSPAERAGLKPGDKVTEVDGWAVKTFSDMQRLISTNPGRALAIVVERDRLPQRLTVTPEAKEVTDPIGNKVQIGQIGIRRVTGNERWERTRHGLVESAGMAVRETWLTTYQIITSLPKIPAAVARIFTGQKQSELGGPLAIAEMSAHAAKGGLLAMLSWIAPLSVMLAVMNLLPIPPLDGGHLMFYAYEGAAGRPLNEKLYEYALKIGFAVLLTLMVAATYSDVMRNVLRLFGQS